MDAERGLIPEDMPGLGDTEAERCLALEGYNEITATRRRNILSKAWEVGSEPMFLLLMACGFLYLLVGETQDALILLSFVFIIMGITFYQERKTERALEALRDLSSPRALVVRGGIQKRIPGREVVRDDLLVLREGDRVPADAVLLSAVNMVVDESLLTGESAPVGKSAEKPVAGPARAGGEDLPFVYSGTLVVRGQGIARVIATGPETEVGKIGKTISILETEHTPLWEETRHAIRTIAGASALLCAAISLLYVFHTGDWTHSLLAGLTLAMSILPEEMPVILTIFLALGAWRMSRMRVLARRAPAVETLGSATVLCVDKTGTITWNRMTAQVLDVDGEMFGIADTRAGDLPERFHHLVEYCILAGKKDPFDPMESAVANIGARHLEGSEHLHSPQRTLVREYPLSKKFMALTHVWSIPGRGDALVAAKGAPEAIADLCGMDTTMRVLLEARVARMASRGLRILAVASGNTDPSQLPDDQRGFKLRFAGLVGFSDPVRDGVRDAVKECHTAGIRVVMITGDYPGTAKSVAHVIGLVQPDQCITGSELDMMDNAELARRIARVSLFARVVPEQKLRIVRAFKEMGEVVAMTGDGVNDAPALKAAHIGVAMGERGTDVAREASAIVITDDDFTSIVAAVRMGRRIYDNIKKAMAYTIAIHLPIAGMAALPAILGFPLIFMPVHIVFLEMVIDPACSIVFEREPEEAGIMDRPPRRAGEGAFSQAIVITSVAMGLSVFAVLSALFWWNYRGLNDMEYARAVCFTALMIMNAGLIMVNRSTYVGINGAWLKSNASLWWLMGGTAFVLIMVFVVPGLRAVFHFAPLTPSGLFSALAAGALGTLLLEFIKRLRARMAGR